MTKIRLYYEYRGSCYIRNWCADLKSPDFCIYYDDADEPINYLITSDHLFSCSNRDELNNKSFSLEILVKGAFIIYYNILMELDYYPEISFEKPLFYENNDELNHTFIFGKNKRDFRVSPFCENVIKNKISPYYSLNNEMSLFIFMSRYDIVTLDILKYTGYNGLTYTTLYAYKDWMCGNGWDENKIVEASNWSMKRYKCFTQTVNNPVYLGPLSRHGGSRNKIKVTKDFIPMELEEAKKHIGNALIKFLKERSKYLKIEEKFKKLQSS